METIANRECEEIEVKDKLVQQFKSIYYLLKGKRDTEIKLFTGYKQFRFSDIKDLNSKIYKKLELHKLVTDIVNVTVGLESKDIMTFGNWNQFTTYDWEIPECTKYISIEWDFNILLPNSLEQIPQTHTLRVRLGNGLKPSEMIQVIFQGGEEHDFEEAKSQAVCKIDFVNSQICAELKSVVTKWYDSLPNNSEDQKIIPFIFRHTQKLRQFIISLFMLSGIIFINLIAFYSIETFKVNTNIDILQKFFFLFSSSTLLIYIFYISGKLYADRLISRNVEKFTRYPMFEITKGDVNKVSEVKKSNKKYLTDLSVGIVASILATGIWYGVGKLLIYIVGLIK